MFSSALPNTGAYRKYASRTPGPLLLTGAAYTRTPVRSSETPSETWVKFRLQAGLSNLESLLGICRAHTSALYSVRLAVCLLSATVFDVRV